MSGGDLALSDPANPSLHLESQVDPQNPLGEPCVLRLPCRASGQDQETNSLKRLHQQIKRTRTQSSSPKNPSFEAVFVPPKGAPADLESVLGRGW